MTLHLHHLAGCMPTPLAHYLKALGIIRLVAEQKDPQARGFWRDEQFWLLTTLGRPALEQFFLEEYAPTPWVSPWNKGAGFFKPGDPGLVPIERSTAPRFADFRAGIEFCRNYTGEIARADADIRALKDQTKAKKGMSAAQKAAARSLKQNPQHKAKIAENERRYKRLKAELFRTLLLGCRGRPRAWMDAAVVLPEADTASFPALLGTGGNDGHLDFTNNAMQRLGDLFDLGLPTGGARPGADELLRHALWGGTCDHLVAGAIGQFFPGSAGGANSTTGPSGESALNPWDLVLALEGACLVVPRVTRRLDAGSQARASAPFALDAHPVGHPSPGDEEAARGEQWFPLWSAPASLKELQSLIGEARMQVGTVPAGRPVDAARAIARLGVARGIGAFLRFGYLERLGQSTMAVPLGRVQVRVRPRARLLDDLAPWMDRLHREARGKGAPARLVAAERRLGNAAFAVLTHDDSPERWQAVLLAAVEIEAVQVGGSGTGAGPIPPLSAEWLAAANDGSPEWRLAAALGSAAASYGRHGRPVDSVRHHWLPLDASGRRYHLVDNRIVRVPRAVATGRDEVADLAAVVERRLIEAAQAGRRHLPLVAAPAVEASPADLAELLAGRVDLPRTVGLARALMALRWTTSLSPPFALPQGSEQSLDESWLAVRLACLPWPLDEHRTVPVDEAIVRRLRSGDAAAAIDLALRRLRAVGFRPPIRSGTVDVPTAQLWAASLAFPIGRTDVRRLAGRFDTAQGKEMS